MPILIPANARRMMREGGPGIEDVDDRCNGFQPGAPVGGRATDQQCVVKAATDVVQPIKAFVIRPIQQEQVGPEASRAVAAERPKATIEQVAGHGGACAVRFATRQGGMTMVAKHWASGALRMLLDFVLPPRCGGCSEIIADVDGFCSDCWAQIEWLGTRGCGCCGLPLEGTEVETCARCMAQPPPIERMRAAVAYGDVPRSIALRLKYGRKIALARTMARYMRPLREAGSGDLVVPVPLHRWRLWNRGFNQSGLVARELGRQWGLPVDQQLLVRTKATKPLKGLNYTQRRNAVAGAFTIAANRDIGGQTILLIDDVLTSGSTAEACARALRKAGAGRIELISWARVVRPAQLMR